MQAQMRIKLLNYKQPQIANASGPFKSFRGEQKKKGHLKKKKKKKACYQPHLRYETGLKHCP